MAFFRTCALLVPAFSAILCSFSPYPRGRLACILSVFSALYRAIARRWAALVLLSCSCIIIHHDTIVYPWLYIHGYISTLHRYFLSFFKLHFLCMVYPWIVRYNIATTTEQPTAPRCYTLTAEQLHRLSILLHGLSMDYQLLVPYNMGKLASASQAIKTCPNSPRQFGGYGNKRHPPPRFVVLPLTNRYAGAFCRLALRQTSVKPCLFQLFTKHTHTPYNMAPCARRPRRGAGF